MEESYTSPFSNDVQNGTRSFVVGLFTGPPPSALQPRMGFGPTAWRAGGNTKTAPFFQITPEVSTFEQIGNECIPRGVREQGRVATRFGLWQACFRWFCWALFY